MTLVTAKSHGKMVMTTHSRAHIQTVGIHLSTNGAVSFISVQSTAEFMAAISLLHSSAVLRTADALSTALLL